MLQKAAAVACAVWCAVALASCSLKALGSGGFTVLYSNDVLGEFENCGCDDAQLGGLSRKAHVLRQATQKGAAVMHLDAGNLFFQQRPADDIEAREFLLKSEYILAAYNAMGCDALNVGDVDLIMGLDTLAGLRRTAGFPFVSTNIFDRRSGRPVFEPWTIVHAAGTRVAVLGVCPQNGIFVPEVLIADPVAAVRKAAAGLRGKVDFFIVLSALGLERDRDLARRVPGINLIVSAHADRLLENAVRENGAAIVQAYTRGQYLGRVHVRPDGSGFSVDAGIVALTPDIGEETDIVAMGNAYKAQVAAMNQQVFFTGLLKRHNPGRAESAYVGGDACGQCHMPQYENWRTTPHARAYQTLVENRSQYAVECLVCHTTGYGQPGGFSPVQKEQTAMVNVQCESCHGPGSLHGDSKDGILRQAGRQVCLGCHTEKNSPRFAYEEYLPLITCPISGEKQ